eukprot:170569_1
MFLNAFLFFIVINAYDDNWELCGIGQQWDNALSDYPGQRTWDPHFFWKDIEPKDNEWDFSEVDNTLNTAIKKNKNIHFTLNFLTGDDAPSWIYNKPWNVPKVYLEQSPTSDPWPYYLNANYSVLFKRFMTNIYHYIVDNKNKDISLRIFANQAMYGSTGDNMPWHGTPVNKQYDIMPEQWWEYVDKPFSLYLYNLYANSTPNTWPNVVPIYNFGENETCYNWASTNCPGSYRKEGDVSHGYQLNYEQNDYYAIGNGNADAMFNKQRNVTVRYRGEQSPKMMNAGTWQEAPIWNMRSLIEWCLTFGLDFLNLHDVVLNNKTYYEMYDFMNKYAGLKIHNANRSIGAWIHLRDGLDSNDTNRFPESVYGENTNGGNSDRMVKIVDVFKDYGAKQEDPGAAVGDPMNQRTANKLNDVGYGCWDANYGQFMKQINPLNTSIGYWRIGDMSEMYGRFGRSFDYKNNKNIICFVLDKNLWNGLPLYNSVNLTLDITYFDNYNLDLFSVGYDNQNDNLCKTSNESNIIIKGGNTNKWVTKTINIKDGYFQSRCVMSSDICLFNKANQDVIFSFINIYKS